MSTPTIRMVDMKAIESILQMGSGYVLDFSDRTFAAFFDEHGVDIDDLIYSQEGTSKANRLRSFLRRADSQLAGEVLGALLEYRLVHEPENIDAGQLERYKRVVRELGGGDMLDRITRLQPNLQAQSQEPLPIKPDLFHSAPIDDDVAEAMIARMEEARTCIGQGCYLSAVILCGSVLEGLCLGYGLNNQEEVNRGYLDSFNNKPPNMHEWRLNQWVDLLVDLGVLTPNIGTFGHGVREFRNYIHPAEQIKNVFSPDHETASISFQVVLAAARNLSRASGGPDSEDPSTDGEIGGLACPKCGNDTLEGERRIEADWDVDGAGHGTPDPYEVSSLVCAECGWKADVEI